MFGVSSSVLFTYNLHENIGTAVPEPVIILLRSLNQLMHILNCSVQLTETPFQLSISTAESIPELIRYELKAHTVSWPLGRVQHPIIMYT